jgi:hypothetical protein
MKINNPIGDRVEEYRLALAEEARIELLKAEELIKNFTVFAQKKGVTLDSSSFSYQSRIGIVASAPNLAKRLIELPDEERDGLYCIKDVLANHEFNRFQSGYFVGTNYMLMAHQFFRRQMNAATNFAPSFIDKFWKFDVANVQKYIAIDSNRLRINVDDSGYFEKDAWYGAPFNGEIEKIPSGTVKLRPPLDLEDWAVNIHFAQTYCLDIKWTQKDLIKTFQALEIKTEEVKVIVNNESFHPARYLHAEFDISTGNFRHYDGAVQLFREDEYLKRRDSDFHINAKYQSQIKAQSKKIFKLNGPVPVAVWVDLSCHFFTGNPLVLEYFNGGYSAHIVDVLQKIKAQRVTASGN